MVAANSDIVDGIQSEINSIVKDIDQVETHMKAVIAEIEKLRETEGDSVVDKITSILKSTQPDKAELANFLRQHVVSKYGYDPTSVRQDLDIQPRILGILNPLFDGVLGCNGFLSDIRFLIALVLTFAVLVMVAANSDIVDGIQSEINSIVINMDQVENHMKAVMGEIEKLRNSEGDFDVILSTTIQGR
eukprot:gene6588-7646_t